MTPTKATAPTFVNTQFKTALGMFATGITIVTARNQQKQLLGLTVNSFNSVSLNPPLVLWSLALQASSLGDFLQGTHYAINILCAEQVDLAKRFASKVENRFADIALLEGRSGVPIIEGSAAVFECFNRSQYKEGDHMIFIGEVEHCQHDLDPRPLIYHRSQFCSGLTV